MRERVEKKNGGVRKRAKGACADIKGEGERYKVRRQMVKEGQIERREEMRKSETEES